MKTVRFIALLAAALMLAGCMPAGEALFEPAREPGVFEETEHTDIPYGELVYEHYDATEFYSQVESFRALADTPMSFDSVKESYERLYGEVVHMFTMYDLIMIEHYAAVNDAALSDEYTYASSELTNMIDAFAGASRDMINSPLYGLRFKRYLGDGATEAYAEYEDMTDREKELSERETELQNEYYRVFEEDSACVYVENGKEWTFESLDAAYPELAYDEYTRLYYALTDELNQTAGEIYLELVDIRIETAELAGYENYSDYAYEEIYSRDYTPEDAQAFEALLKEEFGPRFFAMPENMGDEPYIPTMGAGAILGNIEKYLCPMSPYVQEAYDFMTDKGYYLINGNASMADAGFTTTIYEYGAPFIFMHTYGSYSDLSSVAHEFGHYIDGYYNTQENVMFGGETYDILEVHSTAMELLLSSHYDEIYGGASDYVTKSQYYSMLDSVLMGCVFDEFQQYVYTHPCMTVDELNRYYRSVTESYGYADPDGKDYSYGWMYVPHNFDAPMYYISYATSTLTAMDIWARSLTDYDAATADYLEFLSYGSVDYGYIELLKECGMESFMDEGYVDRVTDPVFKAIGDY